MEIMVLQLGIMAFIAMFVTDLLWTLYVKKVQDKQIVAASFTAAALFLVSAVTTLLYVHNPITLIPAAVGAFLGTYVAGRFIR